MVQAVEEFRVLRKSRAALLEERTERRSLGLVLVRGENVVSLAVEGPPPPSGKSAAGIAVAGRGRGSVGKPTPLPGGVPMGLGAAPMHGIGAPGMMNPPPPPPPGIDRMGMGRGRGR